LAKPTAATGSPARASAASAAASTEVHSSSGSCSTPASGKAAVEFAVLGDNARGDGLKLGVRRCQQIGKRGAGRLGVVARREIGLAAPRDPHRHHSRRRDRAILGGEPDDALPVDRHRERTPDAGVIEGRPARVEAVVIRRQRGDAAELRPEIGMGLGVVDIKRTEIESADAVAHAIEAAERVIGAGRVRYIHPDCGFWMLKRTIADGKIRALAAGRNLYEGRRAQKAA